MKSAVKSTMLIFGSKSNFEALDVSKSCEIDSPKSGKSQLETSWDSSLMIEMIAS